ncbi:MAG: acetylxylan esterase [Chthoniobacteraceae bacterium]
MRHFTAALLLAMPVLAADYPAPADLPFRPSLPDPLVARDGSAILSAGQWLRARRPELRSLFAHYMYGRQPERPARVAHKLVVEDKAALGGAATLREFDVDLELERPVRLLVITPNGKPGPQPCFLGINFNGNHQVLDHPGIALPAGWVKPRKDGTGGNTARKEDRGLETGKWNVALIIERGYAFAGFYHGDVVPDEKELAEPVLRKIGGVKAKQRGPDDTATIMAWAWGFSRMLDTLEQVKEIDAKRVATVGHSRNGKTALVAAAFDERFAMAIPSQAGSGGTGPSRVAPGLAKPNEKGRPTSETVAVITKAFPHWFAGNFSQFADAPARLPFDQHSLIALCAPRPVLLSNAVEDLWANPDGQFKMLQAADPVYKLVTGEGLGAARMPETGKLLPSRLGYFIRGGIHSMNAEDWVAWLDYADRWLR